MNHELKEAIILAGGLGTRLRDAVPDLPKCMAPVAGRPFLFYVINYLRKQGITKFIFSLGYRHEIITQWLQDQFSTLDYSSVIENEPLGTGGAIKLACSKVTGKNVVIVNGDTFFDADITDAISTHEKSDADCTLLLKSMEKFDRYGVVELGTRNQIIHFHEKKYYDKGLINAGIYILQVPRFLSIGFPEKFSFEKDYLEAYHTSANIIGVEADGYFIDIGIPSDFERANHDFRMPLPDLHAIDHTWTLFVDRDGVINPEKKEDYIRHVGEFSFYDGIEQAFQQISNKFGKIVIVSNQRGVGRGLMSLDDLHAINDHMKSAIEKAGSRIDAIYFCTVNDPLHPDRKPNPGMAFRALKELEGIDLKRSLVAGNKLSDMKFGRNAGMYTVFIATTNPDTSFPHPDIDFRFDSLPDFAKAL